MRVITLVMTPVIIRMIWRIITVISLVVTIPSRAALVSRIIIASFISQDGAAWNPETKGDDRSQNV